MANIEVLKRKIAAADSQLQDALDLSIQLRAQSPQHKAEVVKVWEEFLGGFFGNVRRRSREANDNLLAGISWSRLKF